MSTLTNVEKPSQYFTVMHDNYNDYLDISKEDFLNALDDIKIETILNEESFNTYKTIVNDINVTFISYYYLSVIGKIQIWMDVVVEENPLMHACARLSWDFMNHDFDDVHDNLINLLKR